MDSKPPTEEYFRELERVSRNQVIWGGNYFVPMLKQAHKGWLIWDKGQRGLSMSDCELAYTSFDTPTRIFTLNRVELQREGTIHPTQKPVKLYEWVLSLFARKGMKILDTHAGSASSLVACQRIGGLDYVGFETTRNITRRQTGGLKKKKRKCACLICWRNRKRRRKRRCFDEGRKHNAEKDALPCGEDHGRSVLPLKIL